MSVCATIGMSRFPLTNYRSVAKTNEFRIQWEIAWLFIFIFCTTTFTKANWYSNPFTFFSSFSTRRIVQELSRIKLEMWRKWKHKIMFCLQDTIKCDLHFNGFFKVKHQICLTNDSIIIFHVIRLFWLCNLTVPYEWRRIKKKLRI